MLFAGCGSNGRLSAASARHPSQCPKHPIRKPKSRALESDLSQAPDIAEAAVFRLGSILKKFNFDRNAARRRMGNLSGE